MEKQSGWDTEINDISLILAFFPHHFMPKIKGVPKIKVKNNKNWQIAKGHWA